MDAQKVAEGLLASLQNEGYGSMSAPVMDAVETNTYGTTSINELPSFPFRHPEVNIPLSGPSFEFAAGAQTEAEMLRPELLRLADTNMDQNRALMQSAANMRAEIERREVMNTKSLAEPNPNPIK